MRLPSLGKRFKKKYYVYPTVNTEYELVDL